MELRVVGYNQNGQEIDLTGKVTPMIDGCEFGNLQMEGIMFKININEDRSDFTVEISDPGDEHFKQSNKDYWCGACRDSVLTELERGGFDLSTITSEEAEKFDVGIEVSIWVVDWAPNQIHHNQL